MRRVRTGIVGLGNVGRRLLELLDRQAALLREQLGLEFAVVAAADSRGCTFSPTALAPGPLAAAKAAGRELDLPPGGARTEMAALLGTHELDLLVELTPTNLKTAEPGLSLIRTALAHGVPVVTANKGPMVLAFAELTALADSNGARLLYSATVTGGLPTLNLGLRDLAPANVIHFEGILNATTNYILTRMGEGESYAAALEHAQAVGHAEADPSLDVDGWDAANKLVIIANAVLRRPTQLAEVEVQGIGGITIEQLQAARAAGAVLKLVARAEQHEGAWKLTVRPERLDHTHPLSAIGAEMMGVIYTTDINGVIFASIQERDPYPTAAAVLRDMVAVFRA